MATIGTQPRTAHVASEASTLGVGSCCLDCGLPTQRHRPNLYYRVPKHGCGWCRCCAGGNPDCTEHVLRAIADRGGVSRREAREARKAEKVGSQVTLVN